MCIFIPPKKSQIIQAYQTVPPSDLPKFHAAEDRLPGERRLRTAVSKRYSGTEGGPSSPGAGRAHCKNTPLTGAQTQWHTTTTLHVIASGLRVKSRAFCLLSAVCALRSSERPSGHHRAAG